MPFGIGDGLLEVGQAGLCVDLVDEERGFDQQVSSPAATLHSA